MKKAASRGKGSRASHSQPLTQWLELAAAELLRGLAREKGSIEHDADSGGLSDLLRILYPAQTNTEKECHPVSPLPVAPIFAEQIAIYQIASIDQALKTRMGLERGVLDSRVRVLIVTSFSVDYVPLLLAHISRAQELDDSLDGLAEVRKAVGRIWTLDALGLAPVDMDEARVEGIYTENRGLPALSPQNAKNKAGKRGMRQRQNKQPVLVILGFLPFQDEIDRELFASGQALARVKAIVDAVGLGPEKEHAVAEKYAYLLRFRPMPLRDYWGAFEHYLEKPSLAGGFEPASPGVYRELLEQRRQLRSARIQCLQPYTGLYRTGASDAEIIAGCQPIFFRFVEAALCEAGQGMASLVADPEFLDNAAMAGMRKHLFGIHRRITIEHLVKSNRINTSFQQGRDENTDADTVKSDSEPPELAIYGLLKTPGTENIGYDVLYRAHSGTDVAASLFEGLNDELGYRLFTPNGFNAYSFLPPNTSRQYRSWRPIFLIGAGMPIGGMMEKRGGALVDIDRERLERRMRAYFDKSISWNTLAALGTGLTEKQSRFDPRATREIALDTSGFNPNSIMPYSAKPFDNRWCYHSEIKSLWSDSKPKLAALQKPGNRFVISRARKAIADEGIPFFFTSSIGDGDLLRGHTYYFPSWLEGDDGAKIPNLSALMLEYLDILQMSQDISPVEAGRLVWNHVLAVVFSPAYLNENAAGISRGWPKIPFPTVRDGNSEMIAKARELLMESSRLGEMVANLLDLAGGVDGVTQGELRPDFASMAIPWDIANDAPFPTGALDMVPVTMEWGRLSKENAVLPSHGGQMWRDYLPGERLCLEEGARIGGVRAGAVYACLGDKTGEIRLSDQVGIWNVPSGAWHFTLGGYRVLQKWLSYRVTTILGRPLAFDEVESFCQIVRRIAALLLLGPQLNHNYAVIRDSHDAFGD